MPKQRTNVGAQFNEQVQQMTGQLEQFMGLVFIVVVVALFLKKRTRKKANYYKRQHIPRTSVPTQNNESRVVTFGREYTGPKPIMRRMLKASEIQFLQMLKEAFPEFHICPQVSFNALLTHGHYRNKFIRKYFRSYSADFVLFNLNSSEVEAIIELDGNSHDGAHQQAKDAMRDDMFVSAGYRVLRFDERHRHSPQSIRSALYPPKPEETDRF